VWLQYFEPYQKGLECFGEEIEFPSDYENFGKACGYVADIISKGNFFLEGTNWSQRINDQWKEYFRAWEAKCYANLHEHRKRVLEQEEQEAQRWEKEETEKEAKAKEKASSSGTKEGRGMQEAMPPVYAEIPPTTGEQGAMPPDSSSGAEQLPYTVPREERKMPKAPPPRPDYEPPSDAEIRRWKEQERKRK